MIWLIAEDEADILNLVATMCRVWGHEPLMFESGGKAWDWLDTIESGQYSGPIPDFVLMDIRMPGKKGNEVANRMRTMNTFRNTPIALMTAYVLSPADREVMMENDGVDEIVGKPLPSFDELHRLLHGVIERKAKAKQ